MIGIAFRWGQYNNRCAIQKLMGRGEVMKSINKSSRLVAGGNDLHYTGAWLTIDNAG